MLENVRERLLEVRLMRDEREVKIAFILIGLLIIVFLGFLLYVNSIITSKSTQSETITTIPSTVPLSSSAPTTVPSTTEVPVKVVVPQAQTQTQSSIKDYFVPFGSGTNQTSEFTDVSGLQASVDLGGYGNIKEIRFEASVTVPNANEWVSVRLFNVTDKHPVWYSEVTTKGGGSAYLISDPIIYDSGAKTYQVQMKTQLQFPANLVQSRIHITLK